MGVAGLITVFGLFASSSNIAAGCRGEPIDKPVAASSCGLSLSRKSGLPPNSITSSPPISARSDCPRTGTDPAAAAPFSSSLGVVAAAARLLFLFERQTKNAAARTRRRPTATPTPIPIFAPVGNPPLSEEPPATASPVEDEAELLRSEDGIKEATGSDVEEATEVPEEEGLALVVLADCCCEVVTAGMSEDWKLIWMRGAKTVNTDMAEFGMVMGAKSSKLPELQPTVEKVDDVATTTQVAA